MITTMTIMATIMPKAIHTITATAMIMVIIMSTRVASDVC
jgi:hypothetical protein